MPSAKQSREGGREARGLARPAGPGAVDSAARALELLRRSPDVLVECGTDGRISFVSDAVHAVLGLPPEHLVGLSFVEVLVPENRAATVALFRKVVETGSSTIVRFRALRPDGTLVAFEAVVRVFEDDGVLRVLASCRDVTQQRAVQEVDRQRNDYYRALVENGARLAAVADAEGTILFSSQRFKQTFGTPTHFEAITAQSTTEVRRSMANRWYASTRPDAAPSGAIDFEHASPDGRPAWYTLRWDGFLDANERRLFAVVCEEITPRKRVEQALRQIATGLLAEGPESLRRTVADLAEVLEMSRFVLATVGPEGANEVRVVAAYVDGAFLEESHLDVTDLPDAKVLEGETCIHPSGLAQLVPAVRARLGRDFESYAGLPLRRADGTVLGLAGGYGSHAIVDPDLHRSLLSAFATHAAAAIDQARIDAEIRANQDRFDALAFGSDDILIETDAEGRITYVSPGVEPVLGHRPDQLVGRPVHDFLHTDDELHYVDTRRRVAAGDERARTLSRVRHADGDFRWLETQSSGFVASDGSIRTLSLARDVSQRHHAELGRELLHRVVQLGADLVFVCEPDASVLFANDAAIARVGSGASRPLEGRSFFELLSEADAARLRDQVLPALTEAAGWTGDLELTPGDAATPIRTEATVFLFRSKDEPAHSYLAVVLHDVTARRSAEEALHESELRLGQSQKMEAVGRLAGGIAHDFNNLLTAIIGYSDLVLDEIGPGHGARRDAEEILRAAERAGGLTRQLLAFSRRQVLQPESIDLNAIVADVDRMMRRLIGENIELVTLQDGGLDRVMADPGQLEQVIVNLVVNARDAMPRGGRLQIETLNCRLAHALRVESGLLEPGEYVVLRVSDTGIGMDEETRSRIFEPFFTTKQADQGTGLGLASVWGIVSQTGGQIHVETMPRAGTTFSVYLPVSRTHEEPPEPAAVDRSVRGDETILLVEDSGTVRRLVQRTLESQGYRVLACESATAALRYCSRYEEPIHLLLSDVVLRRTSGPAIARRARELRPGIRVLFMSGFTDETLARHGLHRRREDLLEKPFTPSALLSRVRSRLDTPDESIAHAEIRQPDRAPSIRPTPPSTG
ncbi:MAG: PAS domain S-box protein [Spirochaetaceae bacterium]|nr:PAS domain S-box protein [Spirochaetaceae bacterium]